MANKLQIKRSAVPGKVPTVADLDLGELAINTYDGKVYMKKNVSGVETIVLMTGAGAGDVLGPASSGDKAIARFSGTGGKTIQNSSATIDDSGNISALTLQASGTGANKMPVGTTAQRPTGAAGMYRLNSSTGLPEYWNSSKSLWLPMTSSMYTVDVLAVAGGGGGGGAARGGGGGAGGMVVSSGVNVSDGTAYTITIGAGGAAAASGSNTTVGSLITAIGGGRGGSYTAGYGPASGGSGGGGGAAQSGASGTSGQGNAGGQGLTGTYDSGGGGGGASAVGGGGSGSVGGNGGAGSSNSFSGSAVTYAGGGGGCTGSGPISYRGLGGAGGGGDGGYGSSVPGVAGTANRGGGGGGAPDGAAAGAGGSGIVVIRYAGPQRATGGTVTNDGTYTIHTFTTSGTFTA